MGRSRKDRHQKNGAPPAAAAKSKIDTEEEDEEIDEDEAFNSDDERKYGSFFNSKRNEDVGPGEDEEDEDVDSGDEDSSDESGGEGSEEDSDDHDEGDGGQYMLDLLEKLSSKKGGASKPEDESHSNNRKLAVHVKESEFSSSVVKSAGLTFESMMEGIKETKGFGALSKTMKHVAQGKVAASPLPRVAQERLERKVHYEKQAKKISHWTSVVQENRQAETLDFRPQQKLNVTKDMIVEKFGPKSDFEKELDAALREAGLNDEKEILTSEEKALTDDLGANKITLEEFKKRRGELAKMRALMFYHEQKRHHINKIKSKKYRRIRKRQRERTNEAGAEGDADAAKEMEEKEEVARIKERMTLAHKNTSKWAKRVLKRGKNVDLETRRALSAQLKRGDDLRKKMNGGSDDEDDSDEDLVETARKVLEDAESNTNDDAVKSKGLFQLAFMQRGVEKERQRAKEEARALLMELQADEEAEASMSDHEEEKSKPAPEKKKVKPASKDEMKSVLKEGEMVASGLAFGNATSLSVSGAIEIGGKTVAASSTVSEHSATLSRAKAEPANIEANLKKDGSSSDKKRQQAPSSAASADDDVDGDDPEANPWMINDDDKKPEMKKSKKQRVMVDVDRAVNILDAPRSTKSEGGKSSTKSEGGKTDTEATVKSNVDGSEKRALTSLSQEELVHRAFAVDASQAEEEFQKEKEAVREEEENPARKSSASTAKTQTAKGWGSWAGMGAPPPRPAKKNVPAKWQAPLSKMEPQRLRQDANRPDLIVRERRMKQLATNHMLQEIPYPFTSREEYELAMQGGIGREWNVTGIVADLTRPAIQTRAGKIIQPIAITAKKRTMRPAAKF